MESHQGELGMGLRFDRKEFRAPLFWGMARLAIGSEFSLMDVLVAVGARGADGVEFQILMAIRARDRSMAPG